jgi:hypothetical protein
VAERAERAKRVGRSIVPAVALLPVTSSGSHRKECGQRRQDRGAGHAVRRGAAVPQPQLQLRSEA